jgi:5-oxoprolinase (ATP-hydrolysing)
MATVRALAERWMRDAISAYPNGTRTFDDQLDDGRKVCVRIEVEDDKMHIDFSGTSDESPGNLNAPRAVTLACVLYVLRTLMGRPLPLNQGCMIPVRVTIPDKSLLNPSPDRAVAGGNVETSQRIVDVLLGALHR